MSSPSSLLSRPETGVAGSTRPRPLVLTASLGGVVAALGPLVVLLAVGVVGWFVTDAGAHGAPRTGMQVGAIAWLAAHGSGFTLEATRVTIVPLGLTLLCGWAVWRTAHRVGDAVSGHGPDADRITDGERDFTVPVAAACFLAGYVAVVVVTASLAADEVLAPSLSRALTWTVLLHLCLALPAIMVGSGRAAIWATFVPEALRAGAGVVRSVVTWLVAVGTLVVLVSLAADLGAAATMAARLHTSPGEAGLFALVNAAFLPNAALFADAYLLGPGFVVGGATVVSPAVVVLGPLPVFPLLAALPAAGEPAGWVLGLLAVPPLVAAVATFRSLAAPGLATARLRWEQVLLAGCGGGIVAGVLLTALAALSGGAAGPGRMRFVGPFVGDVLVHAVTACGLGGLLGAGVLLLWRRRSSARAEQRG